MTEQNTRLQFFLGANSAVGFASLYDRWVDQASIQAFYVIKGGAGCGKSTLMRRVARELEAAGYEAEYILCSGDPDSLDGVAIPGKGAALVDGTSPHGMDPAYTGATGHYVDLGAGYDRKALFPLRQEIIRAARAYQQCYPLAYRCIAGAEESRRRGRCALDTQETRAKVKKRAQSILAKELKSPGTAPGRESRRFLSGVTCQGRFLLKGTLDRLCDRGYELRDEAGLGSLLLEELRESFLAAGQRVITCPRPEDPKTLGHLILPELSLAFVTGSSGREDFKTLRTESLVEKEAWQEGKSFLRLSDRVAEELMEEAVGHLAQAKAHHDDLEALYHPHVDFSLGEAWAEKLTQEILALPDVEQG
jgi:hypothetical protein